MCILPHGTECLYFSRYYTEVRNFSIVTTLLLATHICLLISKVQIRNALHLSFKHMDGNLQ